MRSIRKAVALVVLGVLSLVLAVVAPAFACAPGVEIRSSVPSGPPGSTVQLTLRGFSGADSPIQVGWSNGVSIDVLATVASSVTSVTVRVPDVASDVYYFTGRQWRSDGALVAAASLPFGVTAPAAPADPPSVSAARFAGYRLVASDGGVFAFGGARFFGSMGGRPLAQPIVGMASTPSGQGYWLVAADGGVFAFGDAGFFGSTGGMRLARPVVGMARTPTGHGYWLVGSDGGIFAFGDAGFLGSLGGQGQKVAGMTTRPDGSGYVLAGVDGTVWVYGAPVAQGGGTLPQAAPDHAALASPVVGTASSPLGGYWLAAGDGGVFTSGAAAFYGSAAGMALARPVVGVAGSGGRGYWLTASDGGIFAFGDAPFLGSTGGMPLARPIVGIAA